jgi:predicted secreted hydrolase
MKTGAAAAVFLAALALSLHAQAPAWRSASPARTLTLPADHASHPEYKLEWWYYTGNVDGADGRRFGYQLTFFRVGVDPAPANPSRWAVRDLFMTHLAVTDVSGRRYEFAERMNRAGPGWAGADTTRYHVWNEDWSVSLEDRRHHLQAAGGEIGIDLMLDEARPPVLHGDHGYSRKGATEGNASHYYSLTRMPTRGTLTIGGQAFSVTGASWMDHEFGTSFLESDQVGWDWFSVQLDDGHDLMVFRIRRSDGSIDPHSSGTLVDPDGSSSAVTSASGFRLEPGRIWHSPASGARYPVEWHVTIPDRDVDLQVEAALDEQELNTEHSTGVTYWEGAIDVTGSVGGRPVKGRGYLEMTGYLGRAMGAILR